jgi:hypothetical protein
MLFGHRFNNVENVKVTITDSSLDRKRCVPELLPRPLDLLAKILRANRNYLKGVFITCMPPPHHNHTQ